MQLPRPLQNLLEQARQTSQLGTNRVVTISATLITPVEQIQLVIPTGFSKLSLFGINHSDDARIEGQLQPSIYKNRILPFQDDLTIEVCERTGLNQITTIYQAIPLGDANPSMGGEHTALVNMKGLDAQNLITVQFQLLEPGFYQLKTKMVDRIVLMGKLDDTLHNLLTEAGEQLTLQGPNAFKGVSIESPIDNPQVFPHITIPQGVKLIKLAEFLQYDDHYGIYSKGLGSYYRKGMWYIYQLYRLGRYKTANMVVDIFRLPQDAVPTLKESYFVNSHAITIMSTGAGVNVNGTDVEYQNNGTGTRVISPEALAGEAGTYYGKGVALTTRQDSVSEFQTAQRANQNEIVPFADSPSANIWAAMSRNAQIDGNKVVIEWHNSYGALITPGMPCRYYYMEGEQLKIQEGTVLSVKTQMDKDSESISPIFRENSQLELYLLKEPVSQ